MNKLTVSTFLFFVAAAANAQTQVPNDFSAGTPARAAEVNENFDALEAAIDQNASDINQYQQGHKVKLDRRVPKVMLGRRVFKV